MVDLNMPELQNLPADFPEEEKEALAQFIEERRAYALQRGLDRGHFYQMTADSIVLNHRPDLRVLFKDDGPPPPNAFVSRLQQTGTEEDPLTEILVESLGHLV